MKEDFYEWLEGFNPERKSRGIESTSYEWTKNGIVLDIYDNGDVVAIAPFEGDKTGFCEVSIEDREWIAIFIKFGWMEKDVFKSFSSNALA